MSIKESAEAIRQYQNTMAQIDQLVSAALAKWGVTEKIMLIGGLKTYVEVKEQQVREALSKEATS